MRLLAFLFSAAVALAAGAADAKDWTTVRIGVEGAYPPFSQVTPDGKLVGFDIDIAQALCDQMKVKCELVQQDWDGIIPALLARKYDAIVASMSITEERKKSVDFTDKYQQSPAKFIRKKGSGIDVTATEIAAPSGTVRVGVQRATIHDNFVTDNFGDKVEVVRYGTQEEANLDLVAGRIDLVLADSATLGPGFLKTPAGANFEFVGPNFTDPKWFGPGAGIAIRKQDSDLKELFNQAIAAIRKSGQYDEIARKYFDFDIYGPATGSS
jgi:arginine/ornithine transport system substrate-binding protein